VRNLLMCILVVKEFECISRIQNYLESSLLGYKLNKNMRTMLALERINQPRANEVKSKRKNIITIRRRRLPTKFQMNTKI